MDHARFKSSHAAATYVSGDLDERTQQAFELHLMQCPACVEEVEVWRAMQAGMREHDAASPAARPRDSTVAFRWRLAASLAVIAVGSGAVGWYGRSFAGPGVADDTVAVFSLPPVTRGVEDCVALRVHAGTELIALRVPNAATGWQLELTREDGTPVDAREYAVRTQMDGSWLLRMRARSLVGEVLRLQTRGGDGITEAVGCLIVPAHARG
ncbi:MAG TPA: zf-HC2 domain-containing protein [Steroidobacteraceae bacterium]|nr:zf-HC2 domain-containing protein [Steroidobacteraceae bacterium]